MSQKEQVSLVIIKPDAISKSLSGQIISSLSHLGLRIVASKLICIDRERAEEHYVHIKDKPFFEITIEYMLGKFHSPRSLFLIYRGEDAIDKIREACGATNPEEADPSSIRGRFGRITTNGVFENVIHASASEEDAEHEIKIWFNPDEVAEDIFPTETKSVAKEVKAWE